MNNTLDNKAMNNNMSRRAVLVASAAAFVQPALAQIDYPTKPIKLIVPFAAGSTPDVFARLVSENSSTTLGQPIIIDNKPGAGGNLGTGLIAAAPADGYTIGASITGPLVNNTVLYKKLNYDPFKDLQPITLGVHQSNIFAVLPSLGVKTLKDLMVLLRTNPGKYNYASIGVGSLSHLSVELLKARTQSFIVHVPYASSPAAVQSLLQGDVDMASLAPLALMPHVKSGKLIAIAQTTAKRSALLPDIPTFKESGLDMDGSAWNGLVAPAGVNSAIINQLNKAFVGAMRDPALVQKLKSQYMDASPTTPAGFAQFLRDELAKWTPVIKRSGASIDG
jgi:tripartite-type tricarboxylate transporter receptor subunit TctC